MMKCFFFFPKKAYHGAVNALVSIGQHVYLMLPCEKPIKKSYKQIPQTNIDTTSVPLFHSSIQLFQYSAESFLPSLC